VDEQMRQLLEDVKYGRLDIEAALQKLQTVGYEKMEFACLDVQRATRQGFPEVIFCQGKSTEQVVRLVSHLAVAGSNVLATRATPSVYQAVKEVVPEAEYNAAGRVIYLWRDRRQVPGSGLILVITAGTADIPVAEEAVVTAQVMGNAVERLYDVGVAGLHRLLGHIDLLRQASVLVVVAGMEGALPSVVGGLVARPVLAVPTSVGGLAALLTMLNSCAAGVAVVNIDNGFGAGFTASLINQPGKEPNLAVSLP
jgi:NCAIR mutase (PurE)-related protein